VYSGCTQQQQTDSNSNENGLGALWRQLWALQDLDAMVAQKRSVKEWLRQTSVGQVALSGQIQQLISGNYSSISTISNA
jgi:hypothetical protein